MLRLKFDVIMTVFAFGWAVERPDVSTRIEDRQDAYGWIADLLNLGTILHELVTKSHSLYREYSSSLTGYFSEIS